jgi:drug/metabolite transporter (DMT)-like permease
LTDSSTRRAWRLPDLGAGTAVVLLGLLSAITWGTGDFGGGVLSRRAPLLALVAVTQLVGVLAALAMAIARGEPFPTVGDIGLALVAGVCGVAGITMLYRGLAEGRMGVVAPTSALLAAVIPVVVGFARDGLPPPVVIVGILVAMLAVVLVTRSPGAQADHPSGVKWGLAAGVAFGGFYVAIGGLSGETAMGPLVVVRLIQAAVMAVVIVAWRQPWRMPSTVVWRLVGVGLLDMAGNAAFILASQTGQLAIAAVLSSLYPVTTVILAIVILRERLTRSHVVGIALTAVAIAMIAGGSAAA